MERNLRDLEYSFFALPEIKPQGWLFNQLRIQAAGLGGKLDQFWPDISDSRWIGGDTDGWERVPYWLDGFIPLATLLDDDGMKKRAKRYIDEILARQQADGWLCPCEDTARHTYDMWALFLILKVLVVWHDATGDDRVEGAVSRALRNLDRHIDSWTLFGWAQTRWYEALVAIYWLYGRTGEQWLLDLAVKLRAQGFDWVAFFENWPVEQPMERGRWSQMSHVVNTGMMLKSGPLYGRLSGRDADLGAARQMLAMLDRWHGTVGGLFTGDECMAGVSPVQGTELCAVVEAMYSLEWLLALTGDLAFGDRLERVAFNMLPATFSPDMEWHQYVQQANQIECSRQVPPVFLTNGPEANLFGVEPNFGCCTANMHQGWPKFAASAVMRAADGVAVMSLVPVAVQAAVNGSPVRVAIDSMYPFRGTARITVETAASFVLSVRIPAWAKGARVLADDSAVDAHAGGFARIEVGPGSHVIDVELPMALVAEPRNDALYALTRGPLVFSLPIGERWVRQDKPEAEDRPWLNNFEVFPTTEWNYGLAIDPANPMGAAAVQELPVGDCPFSPASAPVAITVPARMVPWAMERGAAAPLPAGPAEGPVERIRLIPYGCTNLRMTEMPVV